MNRELIEAALNNAPLGRFDLQERRPGAYQLILPIFHEDGDMVDIYLQDSPAGNEFVRVCDFGLALMRLSYTFDFNTAARQRILDGILHNNGVVNDSGNLYLEAPLGALYESILQFAGCIQKVCNMRYWSREVIRSSFYEDLEHYIVNELGRFTPVRDLTPLQDYPVTVDWSLSYNQRQFYVFGVLGGDKAKVVAISLLELQKAAVQFISLVVHEDMDELVTRDARYLTSNADVQYPAFDEFRGRADADIVRIAGGLAVS